MDKYIIVTGGELRNKGAQAMSFIVTDQMAQKYPSAKVILFSNQDYKRPQAEKENYKFEICVPPSIKMRLSLCFSIFEKLFRLEKKNKNYVIIRGYYKNAIGTLDISGFALSSSWAPIHSIGYMINIMTAKYCKIPVYLLPQSFGPFMYKGKHAIIAKFLIKKYLPYCNSIFAREQEGKDLLESIFGLHNVTLAPDLVLQTAQIDQKNIYHNVLELNNVDVLPGSVGIILNQKLIVHGNEEKVYSFYKAVIDRIRAFGKHVYLVYHAVEDLDLCRELKQRYYGENTGVVLVEHELSCLEYTETVKKFDYIVAARYHSIVLAYRMGIPAIVIGWATKYKDLLENFGQGEYQFDIRYIIEPEKVSKSVEKMNQNYVANSEQILEKLQKIQKDSLFQKIELERQGKNYDRGIQNPKRIEKCGIWLQQ